MRLPNGFGTVYNLGGKRRKPFVAKKTIGWTDEGKQIYQIIGYFKKREEGLSALMEFNKNPYDIDLRSITVEKLYDKWAKDKYKKISQSAIEGYKNAFYNTVEIHDLEFIKVRVNHLQSIIDSFGDNWSKKRLVKVLYNQLYKYAIMNDLCDKNYATYLDLGNRERTLERIPFTVQEINLLWDNLYKIENIDLILIYLYTGFRPDELLLIKKEDITEEYIKGGIKTEAGKNRIVPIHERIKSLIEKRLLNNSKYLIVNTSGNKMLYRYYYDVFQKVMSDLSTNELKLKHTPHDTRHTFATLLDNAGANKVSVQRLLGHSSKDVTSKVYTHKDIEELKKAIKCLI